MSSQDRSPWKTSTVLDQAFLDACADNLHCGLEMTCEIELAGETIYASDRNKYVGNRFYEALLTFPTIERVLGEWLSPEVEFSTLTLTLSNVTGRFNRYLSSGADFGGWINKRVTVCIGLRDVESTYRILFQGTITAVGGFKRNAQSITIIARDNFASLETMFPTTVFTKAAYPNIENDKEGLTIPFVLGDWTTAQNIAAIPAFAVNGNDANVYDGARNNVQCVVSVNALSLFDATQVYMKRGSDLFQMAATDIVSIGPDLNSFQVRQRGDTLIVRSGGAEPEQFEFSTGDQFFVRVKGPVMTGGGTDNLVAQASHILQTYAGVLPASLDASWDTYRVKAAPACSAIASIKSRVWIQEPRKVIEYVRSMLAQVRLECFIAQTQKIALSSLHFEDWDPAPDFTVRNWDVEQGSFQTTIDEQNNFNRVQGVFNYEPVVQEEAQATRYFKNESAIAQAGKVISRKVVFPNLYVTSDVELQLQEILKLSSAYSEQVTATLTWRALLLDMGQFVRVNVKIGSTEFENVPAMVRRVAYIPEGMKLGFSLWSFQMVPFGSWNPGYGGITGGQNATIVAE